jgi:predicted  nucleic acid-binding Zn ribbon protein
MSINICPEQNSVNSNSHFVYIRKVVLASMVVVMCLNGKRLLFDRVNFSCKNEEQRMGWRVVWNPSILWMHP